MELKEWLNSINSSKKNFIDEDPLLEKEYPAYIVNRCMSGHMDSLMYANEMNINPQLDKKLQYDFYLNTLRSKKRFSPWVRKEEISNLDINKSHYGYSDDKARQVLPLISNTELEHIRKRLDRGGLK